MDDNEENTNSGDGLGLDEPHVLAALQPVTATLRAHRHLLRRYPWWRTAPELHAAAPPLPRFDSEHPFE